MERQKQAWDFDEEEEEEEEEEEVGLLGRQSRHINIYTNGRAIENIEEPAEEAEKHEEETNKELNDNVINDEAAADENGVELLKNSVYVDSHQGNLLNSHYLGHDIQIQTDGESDHGLSGMKYAADESYVLEKDPKDKQLHSKTEESDIQRILSTEITHQQGENLEDEILSGLSSPPVQSCCEERSMNLEQLDNRTGVDADVDIVEEIDPEMTEIDVERVLQKQNTHDLYCPNCNSCITRRVILRRKRKVRYMRHSLKRDKFETRAVAEANPLYAANDQDPDPFNSSNVALTHAAADDNHDRQPDIFRCLSCFSIFIPIGNGFRLFRVSGDSNENGKMQEVQSIPASKKNWLFSIFASEDRNAAIDQGHRASEHSELEGINQNNSSFYSDNTSFCNGNDQPVEQVDDRNSVETGALEKDSMNKSQGGVLESLNHSKVESLLLEKPVMAIEHETRLAMENKALDDPNDFGLPTQVASLPIQAPTVGLCPANCASIASEEAGQTTLNSSPKELISYNSITNDMEEKSTQIASLPVKSLIKVGRVNCASVDSEEAGEGILNSSTKESIPYDSVSSDMQEKLGDKVVKNNTEDDVIVVIERQPVEPSSSLRVQDIDTSVQAGILPQSGTQIHVGQRQGAAASEVHLWDILKSIVYGGLVESITSLGVVSSAAGAGAATLDILALGLANLIGGLFIIGHNLRELRYEHSGETSTRMTEQQEDRYEQLLGRRDKFSLHATVVVLSFLIFGLVPPLVYGFSFRKSGNRDLKIAAVAASSFACIILLAVGKSHVQKPPKSYIRTVLYYVCLGFMSSGVSYVIGNLIKKLLEKLNLSLSSIDANISYDSYPMNSGWASY